MIETIELLSFVTKSTCLVTQSFPQRHRELLRICITSMKLTAIALLKWNGDKEPVLFGVGTDLSSFGFFQRGSVKEMLTFVARTVAKRTLVGQRQTVQNEEYYCHAYNRDGMVRILDIFSVFHVN